MAHVKVYTKDYCGYCRMAKNLLSSKDVAFDEINLEGQDSEFDRLKNETGMRTIPIIYINDNLVGGYQELLELENKGELDKLLQD